MRVPLVMALLLVPLSFTAQAHTGHSVGLELTDLQLLFDPLTGGQIFFFHLKNADVGKTGALFATVTLVDETMPMNNVRVSSKGLLPAEEGDFNATISARAVVRGCIQVRGTASGEPTKISNMECGQTEGLTLFPFEVPAPIPAVTEVDEPILAQTPEGTPFHDGLPIP